MAYTHELYINALDGRAFATCRCGRWTLDPMPAKRSDTISDRLTRTEEAWKLHLLERLDELEGAAVEGGHRGTANPSRQPPPVPAKMPRFERRRI